VIGRSARWHTPAGRALLAEDGVAERRRERVARARFRLIQGLDIPDSEDPLTVVLLIAGLIRKVMAYVSARKADR